MLCEGYRKELNAHDVLPHRNDQAHSIPGIYSLHANPQVEALKKEPWPQLLKLFGKSGDRIMMDLLLDCSIFTSLKSGQGNYRQISGTKISPRIYLSGTDDSYCRMPFIQDKVLTS